MSPALILRLARQMGWRAFVFRAGYEFRKRSGLLRRAFPTELPEPLLPTLDAWRRQPARFFFESREELRETANVFAPDENALETLAVENDLIANGHVPFFNAGFRYLGRDYNWLTHPETGYQYLPQQHWTAIRELDPTAGDIKFVWEKARFAYLYPVIRHDFHNRDDRAAFVFSEIESWIDGNPLNCGPHYVCSQETALRVLNWTFALHYYKHSPELTEARFRKILRSVYGQMRHVAANINFSRIAVRNNHAVTECLGLYLAGLLYPFFPESDVWRENGKRWLIEEGLYQIYPDGSYLQFSMNYHRVVVQLFTWTLVLARRNGDGFSDELHDRLKKTLHLLHQHQDLTTGHLPNYGANDGALFFRLNACDYRDFRPQLNALHQALYGSPLYQNPGPWQEDELWMNADFGMRNAELSSVTGREDSDSPKSAFRNPHSVTGFFVLRDAEKFAFVRCGNHPDRPSQADNLHLDLWANGVNLMRDAGSYKYNTDPALLRYFMGTASHNTLQISDFDQMQKGGRFIWYHWSQAISAHTTDHPDRLVFEGKAHVYRHVHPEIFHVRRVTQYKNRLRWEIEDRLEFPKNLSKRNWPVYQRWHPHPEFEALGWRIRCTDAAGRELPRQSQPGWYSSFYGVKEPVEDWFYENAAGQFRTVIEKA